MPCFEPLHRLMRRSCVPTLNCTQIPFTPEPALIPNLNFTKRTQFSRLWGLAGPESPSPWIPGAGAV